MGVPGFVPRLLRDPGIGLFRSDERVFEAMLHGLAAQMLARRCLKVVLKEEAEHHRYAVRDLAELEAGA